MGGAFENEAGVIFPGETGVGVKIPAQHGAAAVVTQKRKRGEMRQVEPFVKDQCGLQAAVGKKQAVSGNLRQLWFVHGNDCCS